ncbi:Sas10 domain-containing protein [Psidium guajava]|nr:Sas10 domain-containing protein [Psidium guajava]
MDLKTSLHPSSSQIHHRRHPDASIMRFILTVTFLIGNALTLVPPSILKRDSSIFRALTSSIMLAFASAFVSLLMIRYKKTGFPATICRWSSMVAMAAVSVLLLFVLALHQQ